MKKERKFYLAELAILFAISRSLLSCWWNFSLSTENPNQEIYSNHRNGIIAKIMDLSLPNNAANTIPTQAAVKKTEMITSKINSPFVIVRFPCHLSIHYLLWLLPWYIIRFSNTQRSTIVSTVSLTLSVSLNALYNYSQNLSTIVAGRLFKFYTSIAWINKAEIVFFLSLSHKSASPARTSPSQFPLWVNLWVSPRFPLNLYITKMSDIKTRT